MDRQEWRSNTRLGGLGIGFEFVGAAAMSLWPQQTWIAWLLLLLGAGLIVMALIGLWRAYRDSRAFPASLSEDRIPINEFYRQAKRFGWKFATDISHVFDMGDGLKQAGADGAICFWGRRTDSLPSEAEREFLHEIPARFWTNGELSAISPFELDNDGRIIGFHQDNNKVETRTTTGGYSGQNYRDVHVNQEQAVQWLNGKSKSHMGKNTRRLNRCASDFFQ